MRCARQDPLILWSILGVIIKNLFAFGSADFSAPFFDRVNRERFLFDGRAGGSGADDASDGPFADGFIKRKHSKELIESSRARVEGLTRKFPVADWISKRLSADLNRDLFHRRAQTKDKQNDTSLSSMEMCLEDLKIEEVDESFKGIKCSCNTTDGGEATMLRCVEYGCKYCDDSGKICIERSYGSVYQDGVVHNKFVQVRDVANNATAKLVTPSTSDETGCELIVNGTSCDICSQIQFKSSGDVKFSANCENISDGLVLEACQGDITTEPSLLRFFQGGDEYGQCVRLKAYEDCLTEMFVLTSRDMVVDLSGNCTCAALGIHHEYDFVVHCSGREKCSMNVQDCVRITNDIFFRSDDGNSAASIHTFLVTRGNRQESKLESIGCDPEDPAACESCNFSVGGKKCTSCELNDCFVETIPGLVQAVAADCRNVFGPNAIVDFCTQETHHEPFLPRCMNDLLTPAFHACGEDLPDFKKRVDPLDEYNCFCKTLAGGSIDLQCIPKCGVLCNDDMDMCGSKYFLMSYPRGSNAAREEESLFHYRTGRNEFVYISHNSGNDSPDDCIVSVLSPDDFSQQPVCSFCQHSQCPTGQVAPQIDCGNLEIGAVFDLCDTSLSIKTGVFQFLSQGEFDQCIDLSPKNYKCSDSGDNPTLRGGDSVIESTNTSIFDDYAVCVNHPPKPGHWFKFVGTGRLVTISTCNGESSFDTTLYVYQGTCELLHRVGRNIDGCNAGDRNPVGSSLSWIATGGVTYSIRVSGHLWYFGDYNLTVEEEDISSVVCEDMKSRYLEYSFSPVQPLCECMRDGDSRTLFCSEQCEFCDMGASTRGRVSTSIDINGTGLISRASASFEHTVGNNGTDVLTQDLFHDGIETCQAWFNGVRCEECTQFQDSNGWAGSEFAEVKIQCESANNNTEYDSRDSSFHISRITGALIQFLGLDASRCRVDPVSACTSSVQAGSGLEEETVFGSRLCRCEVDDGRGATMICEDQSCWNCDALLSECGMREERTIFDSRGVVTKQVRIFRHKSDRFGTTELELPIPDVSSNECIAYIDGIKCSSCSRIRCANGLLGWDIDCSDDEVDTIVNSCVGRSAESAGPLGFLLDPSFEICLDTPTSEAECASRLGTSKEVSEDLIMECACDRAAFDSDLFFYRCATSPADEPTPRTDSTPPAPSSSFGKQIWLFTLLTVLLSMDQT